ATDGSRLSLAGQGVAADGLKGEERLLIPRRALGLLRRLAGAHESDTPVAIAKDDSHLFFSAGDRVLISRMISGQFPNYEAILPRSNGINVTVEADVIRQALERVSLLASEHSHGISLMLDPGRVTLSTTNSDAGEATESVDASYQGEPLRVAFNCLYLLDFFSAVKTGQVEIALKDDQSAAEFRPVDADPCHYRYVLMPMRL
ncbi:MAG TPA: DNA polymerase III subunit beta, partial [Terriglobia bacterium]|nr:DNA polymerase III subunit beta [Terriglobia bacterium]